jgi:hypothetical protein
MKKSIVTALLLLGLVRPPAASANPLVLAWLGNGQLLKPKNLAAIVNRPAQKPDQIVFLVHGYSDTRQDSATMYKTVSALIEKDFRARHQRVLVVGVQWHAALPGNQLPWKMVSDYLRGVAIARRVGHGPMRQLVSSLHQRYPHAQMNVFAHSLGSEVTMASAFPDLHYTDKVPKSDPYAPGQTFAFNEIVLGQADLDYDIWYKSQVKLVPGARMLWLTVAPYRIHEDEALAQRHLVRGKAGSTRFPRMTTTQYDYLFKNRAVLFDSQNLIQQHGFLSFYSKARIQRVVKAAAYLAGAGPEPQELRQMDKILAMSASVQKLLPWLDNHDYSCRMYALWRIEQIVDGGSQHFADRTIDNVDLLLRDRPSLVWKARKTSKCTSIRDGYWPTQKQMTRAGAPSWAKKDRI